MNRFHQTPVLSLLLVGLALLCPAEGLTAPLVSETGTTEAERLLSWAQLDAARQAYARSLAAAQQRQDERAMGLQSLQLGLVVQAIGEIDAARKFFYEAARFLRQSENLYPFGRALIGLADIARNKGETDLAAGLYRRVMQEVEDPFLQDMAARHLAWLFRDQGRFDAIIELLEPRVGSARTVLSRPDQLRSLEVLRQAYEWNGQPEEQQRIQRRMTGYWSGWLRYQLDEDGPSPDARTMVDLGLAQWKAGEADAGRKSLTRAQRTLDGGKDWHGLSQALLGIGDIAREQGEPVVADRYYRKAAPLVERINSLWRRLQLLDRQIALAEDQQKWSVALSQLETKIEMVQRHGVTSLQPATRLHQVRILHRVGRPAAALPLAREALYDCARQENRFCQAAALFWLARLEANQGDAEMAARHAQEAEGWIASLGLAERARDRLRKGAPLPATR